MTICYPLKLLLRDFLATEDSMYLFTPSEYLITKKVAAEVLEGYMDTFAFMDKSRNLHPNCVIDSKGCEADGFTLHSYPVMPDGSVLVVVSRTEGTKTEFRVFRYQVGTAEPTEIFEFELEDKVVTYLFVDNGKLYVIANDNKRQCILYSIIDDKAKLIRYVGNDVCAVAADGNGHLAVGYSDCIDALEGEPVGLFNLNGDSIAGVGQTPCAGCISITLDGDGNFAWNTRPGRGFECVDIDEECTNAYFAEYTDFDAFGFSDDNSMLLTVHTDTAGHCLLNRIIRNDDGYYLDAKRVNIKIANEEGDDGHYTVDGKVSILGSTLVWNRNGRLYVCDINSLATSRKVDDDEDDCDDMFDDEYDDFE